MLILWCMCWLVHKDTTKMLSPTIKICCCFFFDDMEILKLNASRYFWKCMCCKVFHSCHMISWDKSHVHSALGFRIHYAVIRLSTLYILPLLILIRKVMYGRFMGMILMVCISLSCTPVCSAAMELSSLWFTPSQQFNPPPGPFFGLWEYTELRKEFKIKIWIMDHIQTVDLCTIVSFLV
jgi:hypothetical protein